MKLKLFRFVENDLSTVGRLFIDGDFFCYTLEDAHHDEKIPGKTRIPSGVYELGYGPDESPLTAKYRTKYPDFFKKHIEVKGVKDFNNVYIHVGNRVEDTEGCILVGGVYFLNGRAAHTIGNSVKVFKELYSRVFPAIDGGVALEVV